MKNNIFATLFRNAFNSAKLRKEQFQPFEDLSSNDFEQVQRAASISEISHLFCFSATLSFLVSKTLIMVFPNDKSEDEKNKASFF